MTPPGAGDGSAPRRGGAPPAPAASPGPARDARGAGDIPGHALLDALPCSAAVIDRGGRIVDVNRAWRRFARENGLAWARAGSGSNYLDVCDAAAARGDPDARSAADGLRAVLAGTSETFALEYPCHAPDAMRWFCLEAGPCEVAGGPGAVVLHLDVTERRRAELELEASEARSRERSERIERIQDLSMDVICTLDAQGRFLTASAAARRVFGREPSSLVGTLVFDLLDEEDAPAMREVIAGALRGDAVESFETRCIHAQRGRVDVAWSVTWLPGDQMLFCVARDVTAARRAKARNDRLTDKLRRTLENIPDAFYLLDPEWRFTYVNDEAERLLRRSRDQLLGRVVWTEFPEAAGTVFFTEFHRAVAERRKAHFEAYYAPLDTWFAMHAYPSREGLAVYCLDVSQRCRAERAVAQSEQRLRTITRVTADVVWEWDVGEGRTWWSEGLREPFGLASDGEPDAMRLWQQRMHPEDRERMTARVRALLATDEVHATDEYRFRRADGSYALVHHRAFVERDAKGRAVRIVGSLTDVTERRRSESEARRAAEMRALLSQTQQALGDERLDFGQLMELLRARATELTDADGAVVELMSGPGQVAARYADPQRTRMIGRDVPLESSFSGEILRAGRVVCCADTHADPRVDQAAATEAGARALLGVPLKIGTESIGVLKVIAERPHAFDGADQGHLQALADTVRVVLERQRALEQLRESANQYRLLFEQSPHPKWVHDLEDHRVVAVNDAALAKYGYREDEFLAMRIGNDDVPEALWVEGGGAGDVPGLQRHRRRDGTVIDIELSAQPLTFRRRPAHLVLATDVTARVRAQRRLDRLHRAQQLLSACNVALTRAEDEPSLLQGTCRLAVDLGGFSAAWVAFRGETDGDLGLGIVACAGVERSEIERHVIAGGPLAFVDEVLASGRPSEVRRLEAADAPDGGPSSSVLALPLLRRSEAFGVLCLHAQDEAQFEPELRPTLMDLAGDLSFGIDHLREQRERWRLESAVVSVAAGVSGTTGSEFLESICSNMVEALDANGAFIAELRPGGVIGVLAGVMDGQPVRGLEYGYENTPCEELLHQDELVVTCDLSSRYPGLLPGFDHVESYVGRRLLDSRGRPLGLLFMTSRSPIGRIEFKRNMLRIFAARVASELERREHELRLQDQASLLDQANDAIVLRSLQGSVRFWSRGAQRLFGWTPEEAIGQGMSTLLREDAVLVEQALESVLATGDWTGVMRLHRKDGANVATEGHWTLVRDGQGGPRAILAIHTDISRRLAMEAQLQQAQRLEAVGQLTGGLAHDFNNLLTVILGNAELLEDHLRDDDYGERLAAMVRTAAERGSDLTHRLLAFARRQSLEPRAVDVNALMHGMRAILKRTLGEDIRIELVTEPGLDAALADAGELESAVLNLCLNARDAMHNGGDLRIRTRTRIVDPAPDRDGATSELAPGAYIEISVADTGSGIAPEHLARVFEPFFTTKPVGKGSGLGLSMVYGFVKQSRGHVEIDSAPGRGTCIKMLLPSAQGLQPVVEGDADDTSVVPGSGTILMAEDDPLVKIHVASQLEQLGYTVIAVDDGPAALEVLRSGRAVDLLLTDVVMPGGLRGSDLVEAARRLRPGLPSLYTSGYADMALDDLPPDRAAAILRKPYRRSELAHKVRSAMLGVPNG